MIESRDQSESSVIGTRRIWLDLVRRICHTGSNGPQDGPHQIFFVMAVSVLQRMWAGTKACAPLSGRRDGIPSNARTNRGLKIPRLFKAITKKDSHFVHHFSTKLNVVRTGPVDVRQEDLLPFDLYKRQQPIMRGEDYIYQLETYSKVVLWSSMKDQSTR